MNRLKDKVAIVTGGNSGIGEAIAELFASEGAKVVVASLGASAKDNIAKKLKAMGADYMMIPCDISNVEDVKKCFDKTMKKYGRLDVMVNNAGVLEKGLLPIDKFELDAWEWVTKINTFGTMLCIKHATNIMKEQLGGSIINIASVAANGFGGSVYVSTKAAICGVTRNTAMRFAGSGIRCNAICPGSVLTPMTTTPKKEDYDPDMFSAMSKYGNLEVGISMPMDIAYAALFLRIKGNHRSRNNH